MLSLCLLCFATVAAMTAVCEICYIFGRRPKEGAWPKLPNGKYAHAHNRIELHSLNDRMQ